jgi:hypothetical protein
VTTLEIKLDSYSDSAPAVSSLYIVADNLDYAIDLLEVCPSILAFTLSDAEFTAEAEDIVINTKQANANISYFF